MHTNIIESVARQTLMILGTISGPMINEIDENNHYDEGTVGQ